jgi:hypothetical protein
MGARKPVKLVRAPVRRLQLFRDHPARTSSIQLHQRIATRRASADQLNCLSRDALTELVEPVRAGCSPNS